MRKPVVQLLILFFLVLPLVGNAQILAPAADFTDTVAYYNGKADDSAYIYADTINYPTDTIQWEIYVPGTGFQPLSSTSSRIKIDVNTVSQGYRLILTNGNSDTAVCWALINDFNVEITSKDAEGDITRDALTSGDCVFIGYIEMEYNRGPLIYYNPDNDSTHSLTLGFTYDYETDPVISDSDYGKLKAQDPLNGKERFYIDNSWWQDAIYTIKIIDEANLEREDYVNVTAIRPRAIISFHEPIPLDDEEYYEIYGSDYYNTYNSAPGFYYFESGSFNADSLVWNFGDSTSITTEKDTIVYQYTKWGIYKPRLEAINYFDFRQACYHQVSIDEDVEFNQPALIEPGKDKAQNVFNPPNGELPIWRYDDLSITDFEIAVYNRYGRRVHHFKGNVRDWAGWDGRVNDGSNYASTGVYFYVIKDYSLVSEFNDPSNSTGNESSIESGSIHLFNTE